ncbi:MAG: hypothetical protein WB791_03655 [Waddliaceae bacterium]
MKMINVKRRFVTLIEMMIVMFLIALITGVIAWNYRGTLNEGKAFKTQAGIKRLENILDLAASDNANLYNDIESNWQQIVRSSPLVQNANALIKDGWGQEYTVTVENDTIQVRSHRFSEYVRSNPTMFSDEG